MRNPLGVTAALSGRVVGHVQGDKPKATPGLAPSALSLSYWCPHRDKSKKLHPTLQKGKRRLGFPGAAACWQLLVGILQCLVMQLSSLSLSGALLSSIPLSQHRIH